MKRPLALVCTFHLIGTASAIATGSYAWVLALSLSVVILVTAACFALKLEKIYILFLSVAFVVGALNFIITEETLNNRFKKYDGEHISVEGWIASEPDVGAYSSGYVMNVKTVSDGSTSINTGGKLLVWIPNTVSGDIPVYGSRLKAYGVMEMPKGLRNPGGFDYQSYLAGKGISGIMSVKGMYLDGSNRGYFPVKLGLNIKKRIAGIFGECLPEQQAGLMSGMLIGYIEGLGEEVNDAFRSAGLSHIMAVSGANLVFLIAPLLFILKLLGIGRNHANIICIISIALFTLITGFEASVLRAAVMVSLLLVGGIIKREADIITSIAAAASILVAINPYNLLNVGFQLTFAATLSLVLFTPKIGAFFKRLKIPSSLAELLAATTAAQLGVIPVSVVHFNSISVISLLSNVIVVPLTGLITVLGMITAITGMIFMPAAKLISYLNCALLSFVLYVTKVFAGLSFATIIIGTPSVSEILAYYGALFLMRSDIKTASKITVIGALVCSLSAVSYFSGRAAHKGLEIIHFDVDYGDSAFIRTEEGVTILVDSGGSSASGSTAGERVILPYLMSQGIRRLDLIIASHDHNDHTGGIIDILNTIKVAKLAVTPYVKAMEDIFAHCEARGTEVIRLQGGDNLRLGIDKEIDVLYPMTNDSDFSSNNLSMVLKLKYKETEFLFTGDIEIEAETLIIQEYGDSIRGDALKVPHHGSKTSSSEAFLKKAKPTLAVISVGRNSWGHPDPLTLNELALWGAKVFRTDMNGAIRIKTDGNKIEIRKTVN